MKKTAAILILFCAIVICGCGQEQRAFDDGRLFLNVDFTKGVPLRYEFVSKRELSLNWQPEKGASGKTDRTKETFRMVLRFLPIEVDEFGLSKLSVNCESIRVESRPAKAGLVDAAMKLKGRSYIIEVSPTGEIVEMGDFEKVVQELGAMSFRGGDQAHIKEPDMISDILAAQWFMWDPISSVETPIDGVVPGESWNSRLSIPGPMLARLGREVTYTLSEVRPVLEAIGVAEADKISVGDEVATISAEYGAASKGMKETPWPYGESKSFQMAGKFGFLGGYKLLELDGGGEVKFNVTSGELLSNEQSYEAKIETAPPFGIDVRPILTIKQKLSTKLL